MIKSARTLTRNIFARLLIFFLLVGAVLPADSQLGWGVGYLLGLLAIVLHFVMSFFSKHWSDENFFLLYTPAMIIRLIVVLAIFIGLLIWEKFDQFSFTVSFLISYICHSVINIILLNKELTDRSG